MDSPSIGYLWIKTKRYRVIKGTDEARDKLYEEVEYLDDDSSSSSSSASSEKGDGKVRNANKSNEGTKLAPNANINVSAAPPSNGIADEDMLMSVVRGTSSDQSVTGLQASRSFCDGRSNVRPFFSKEYHQRSHGQPVEDEYSLASDVSRSLRHHAHRPAVERRRRYGGGRHSSPSTLNVSEHVSQLPPGSGSSSATATAVTLHEELRQRQPQQFRQAPISAAKVDFTRKRDEEARFTDEDGSSRSWTTVSYFTLEEPERMRIPTKRTSRHQTKQLQQQQQQQAGLDTPSLSTLHFNRLGSTHSAIKINDVGCRNSEQFPEFHSSASSVKRQLMAPANVVGSRISSGEHLTTLGAIGDGGKSRATVESRDVDDLYRLKAVDNRQQTIDCANTCAADYASSDNISDDMSNSDLSLLTMSNESTKEEDVYYEQVRWHRGGADATTPLLKHHQRSRDNFEMPRREHSSSHGDGGHHRHHVQRLHRDQLQQERLLTQPLDHHPFQRKDANNSSHQRSHRHHHHCSRHDSTDANDMATDYVMHTDAGSRVHRSRLNVIADSNCDQWWNQIPTDDGDKPTMRTKLFDNKAKNYENRSRETRRQPDKCPSASAIHTAEHEQSARMPMSLTLDSRIHRYDVSHGRRGESTTTTTTNDPLMISMQQSGTSNDEEYFDPYVEENLSHTSKATGSCDDDQWRVQFPLPLNVNNNSVIAADVTVTQSGNGLSFIDKGRHNYEFDASRSVARDATETAKTGSRTVGDKDEVAFRRFYRSQSQSSENDRRRPMLQQTDALRRTGVSLLPLVLLPNRPRHRPRGSRDVASVHRSVAEPAAGIGDKRKQQQKPRTTK
jgi:hypothetical protein